MEHLGMMAEFIYVIVNSEIFARIIFSLIAFKDIFATLKIATKA